jgi:diguanylate cyclase (GGDEF)-like protein
MREPVGEPLAPQRWSAPARLGGALAFVVISVVPYALLMNWLLGRSEVAKEAAEAADEVLISARTMEGLEHMALSGEGDLRGLRSSFTDESAQLLDAGTGERAWVWRDITGRKQLEMHLSYLALHDPLTGLANRTLFEDRIEHALAQSARTKLPTTVLFCDIDKFKELNDTLGHAGGDQLLNLMANRLLGAVRTGDTVARLGGDEFAVILESTGTRDARATAERILKGISAGTTVDGRDIRPTVSIGAATSTDGSSPEEIMRGADVAMYDAKRAGGNQVVISEGDRRGSTTSSSASE